MGLQSAPCERHWTDVLCKLPVNPEWQMISPRGEADWPYPYDNTVIIVNYCQTYYPRKNITQLLWMSEVMKLETIRSYFVVYFRRRKNEFKIKVIVSVIIWYSTFFCTSYIFPNLWIICLIRKIRWIHWRVFQHLTLTQNSENSEFIIAIPKVREMLQKFL